jgi:MATE family multidrug resistance protein
MSLNKEILRLSIPSIISNITVPLLGLCDTTISGHLGNLKYLGAIAVGSMMCNALFWLFGFLRMGSSGLTAQAFGSGDKLAMRRLFSQASALGLGCGLAILLLQYPLAQLLLAVMQPDTDVAPLASRYFHIAVCGAPALLATMAMQGWMLGMQNTMRPMIVSIAVNIINILLSILFVFPLKMGFEGIALGTLCANWAGMLLALTLCRRFFPKEKLWVGWKELFTGGGMKRMFRINSDIFFRSACIMIVTMAVTAIGSRLGALTLATNAVMMQFFHIFSYFMDGLAFTGEALCGRYYGANDMTMLRRCITHLMGWGAVVMIAFLIVYTLFSNTFAALITSDMAVIANIRNYDLWLTLIPPITVAAFIFDGIFIGLSATRQMLVATATAAIAFFAVALVNITDSHLAISIPSNDRLWAAFLTYLFLRGAILGISLFCRNFAVKDKKLC